MDGLMRDRHQNETDRSDTGFTLLEIAISLAILAFGLLSLAAMQLQAMGAGRSGRHTTQALALAESQMEQLHRMRWTSLAPASWASIPWQNAVDSQNNEIEQSYSLRWRTNNDVANVTRSLDVTVVWDEPNRPNRSVTISSTRFNHEGL
jgi:prepilin-type N-terminal cleavage/methylation domain-containing protein